MYEGKQKSRLVMIRCVWEMRGIDGLMSALYSQKGQRVISPVSVAKGSLKKIQLKPDFQISTSN